MRKAVRARLVAQVSSLGGRIYEPTMAGPSTTKPYAVVKMSGESPTNIRQGFTVTLEVWIYTDRLSFEGVDTIVRSTIDALVSTDFTTAGGEVFSLRFVGAGADFYDDDWQAIGRQLLFETVSIWGG